MKVLKKSSKKTTKKSSKKTTKKTTKKDMWIIFVIYNVKLYLQVWINKKF
jgi:hypothetical protein